MVGSRPLRGSSRRPRCSAGARPLSAAPGPLRPPRGAGREERARRRLLLSRWRDYRPLRRLGAAADHRTGGGRPASPSSERRSRGGVCSRAGGRPAARPVGGPRPGAEGAVPRRCSVPSSAGAGGDRALSDSQAGCPAGAGCRPDPGTPSPPPEGPSPSAGDPVQRRAGGGPGGRVAAGSPGRERTARASGALRLRLRLRPRRQGRRRARPADMQGESPAPGRERRG